MSISACMHGRLGRLSSLFLVAAMSSVVGCSQNETVEIDGFVRSIASPLGQECRETCDEVTTCVEVEYNCQTERYDCGWEWVGWFSIEYRCDERRVCDTREDCTVSLSNCREDCTRLAYPDIDETPLLNALNYWSTDEISGLGIKRGWLKRCGATRSIMLRRWPTERGLCLSLGPPSVRGLQRFSMWR